MENFTSVCVRVCVCVCVWCRYAFARDYVSMHLTFHLHLAFPPLLFVHVYLPHETDNTPVQPTADQLALYWGSFFNLTFNTNGGPIEYL